MSNKQITRIYWASIIVAAVVICGIIVQAFLSNPSEELLPAYALAELYVSALAFLVVWLTLIFIIIRLRKSMAKPELKVFFNETSTSESTIVISQDKPLHKRITYALKLSILNTGNAITDLFQIDFEIPEIFEPRIPMIIPGTVETSVKSGTHKTVSFINNKVYVCFVNRPREICSLEFLIQANVFNEYPNPLIIPYKIYGDWAEIQEGELKVNINKQ